MHFTFNKSSLWIEVDLIKSWNGMKQNNLSFSGEKSAKNASFAFKLSFNDYHVNKNGSDLR